MRLDDEKDVARLIAGFRRHNSDADGVRVALHQATINIILTLHELAIDGSFDPPKLTDNEAKEILENLPTTYDREQEILNQLAKNSQRKP